MQPRQATPCSHSTRYGPWHVRAHSSADVPTHCSHVSTPMTSHRSISSYCTLQLLCIFGLWDWGVKFYQGSQLLIPQPHPLGFGFRFGFVVLNKTSLPN